MTMKSACRAALALALTAVMLYSGYRAWQLNAARKSEAQLHAQLLAYKPEPTAQPHNQAVIELQQAYPDAVGWLSIPGTAIDYPFVQSDDNDYYLRRDLDGKHAPAGTLFLDCRCEPDFTSQSSIIYGHNMRSGSMFGTLQRFADKAFFDANPQGAIYLPRATLTLQFFAYMVVQASDAEIYSDELNLEYVKQNARQYREIELAENDKFVILTTCSYEFDSARMILIAKTL